MTRPYVAADWYWFVTGDETRAWSSAAAGYVPADDPGLKAFLEDGNQPTRILNEEELKEVLLAQYPAGWHSYDVPKALVVSRLTEAGKLRAAFTALKLETPIKDLTDAELVLRERWNAGTVVTSDDPIAHGLLSAIGADPSVILARP